MLGWKWQVKSPCPAADSETLIQVQSRPDDQRPERNAIPYHLAKQEKVRRERVIER